MCGEYYLIGKGVGLRVDFSIRHLDGVLSCCFVID